MEDFFNACSNGDLKTVTELIEANYYDSQTYRTGLMGACWSGNKELVELLIDKGATNFDSGFVNACGNNHLEIALLMINSGLRDWDSAIANAVRMENNVKIIKLISRLSQNRISDSGKDCAMFNVCVGGNLKQIKYVKKVSDKWNRGLEGAVSGQHKRVMGIMIRHGAKINKLTDAKKEYLIETGFLKQSSPNKPIKNILLKDLRRELGRYVNY